MLTFCSDEKNLAAVKIFLILGPSSRCNCTVEAIRQWTGLFGAGKVVNAAFAAGPSSNHPWVSGGLGELGPSANKPTTICSHGPANLWREGLLMGWEAGYEEHYVWRILSDVELPERRSEDLER